MSKLLGLKLLGILGLGVALILAGCGGGGGDSGTPLVPPTSKLTMTPKISGLAMSVGQFAEPVKITGGQKPYRVWSSTGNVIPTILDDGTLYLQAVGSTLSAGTTSCASNSGGYLVSIQDNSYNQTTLTFSICVASGLTSTLGSSPSLSLAPGQTQNFTVFGGAPSYTAVSTNSSVASVSGGSNGVFTITAGKTSGSANIVVTDADASSFTITVQNAVAAALAVNPTTLSGAMGNSLFLSVSGGAAPYTAASSNPSVATASVNGSSVSVNLVGAGSTTITITDAASSKPVTATVTVAAGFAVLPPSQILAETATAPVSFSLYGGTGPYYVSIPTSVGTIPTSSLISVSPMSMTDTSKPVTVTLATTCIKSDKTIPLTVTDAGTGKTATATVQIQNTNTANDGTAGCL